MSSVIFQTKTQRSCVSGSERAYITMLLTNLTYGVLYETLDCMFHTTPPFLKYISSDSHLLTSKTVTLPEMFVLFLHSGVHQDHIVVNGVASKVYPFCLNTAIIAGDIVIKLLARFEGQCEKHCWFPKSMFEWVANKLESGRTRKILRPDMGWENVIGMLRTSEDEECVLSFSGTDSFPTHAIIPDAERAAYNSMSSSQQWDRGMLHLREIMPEITIFSLETDLFTPEISAFDILEEECRIHATHSYPVNIR